MEVKKQGVVIKGIGGNYDVACEGEILRCRASAKIKHQKNLLAAGEYVELRLTDDGGYITERLPRRNGLIRPAIANIDQLVILCSQAPPVTDPYLIDKVTVVALYQGIQPIILLNKADSSAHIELKIFDPRIDTVHLHRTGIRHEHAVEQLCHSGFAATVRSGNSHKSVVNYNVYVPQDLFSGDRIRNIYKF